MKEPVDPYNLRAHHRFHPHLRIELRASFLPIPRLHNRSRHDWSCHRDGILPVDKPGLRSSFLIIKFGMMVLALLITAAWKAVFTGMEEEQFFIWVISIHIIAWILQFIGHGVFESICSPT